jgi:hypothetical protein
MRQSPGRCERRGRSFSRPRPLPRCGIAAHLHPQWKVVRQHRVGVYHPALAKIADFFRDRPVAETELDPSYRNRVDYIGDAD